MLTQEMLNTMTDEQRKQIALEARRRHNREWRKKHPEKQKEYWQRHYLKLALEYAQKDEMEGIGK